jgi:iron complex transport system substrate-binding protein
MSRPDFAFKTSTHTWVATAAAGVYRAEPGGTEVRLSIARQEIPAEVRTPELERVVMSWVISRGGRTLNLDGTPRPIAPGDLDRPAPGPVRRLVSIAPSNAEIVGALGAAGLLVGVESSSDFPPEVQSLPRLGPDLHVDMAALAALRPDLVLASLCVPGMERNIAGLERIGVPYIVLAPQSLADIRSDILRTGAAIGTSDAAGRVVADMDARLDALREQRAGQPAVPLYLEWWPKPMFTPGRACWSNELIALAGGRNVFADQPGQSAEVAPEAVARANPAVIVVAWCGVPFDKLNVNRVLQREGLESVSAVRTRRVHAVDESLLGRPGPRVVEGIEHLARAIQAPGLPAQG